MKRILALILSVALIGLVVAAASQINSIAPTPTAALGLGLGLLLAVNSAAYQFLGGYSGSFGLTALDIAKLNGSELSLLVEKNKLAAPELNLFPAFTVGGTGYETTIRTGYPSGAFTTVGGGVTPGGSSFDVVKAQTYNYENPLQERLSVLKRHRKGQEFAMALAMSGAVKGGIELIGRSVYYGARAFGGGTNAFPGLIDLYDASTKFIDATGTTAGTGSSAWFVKFGDMEDGMVSMVFGNDQLFASREWILQQLAVDGGTGVTDVMTNLLAAAVGVALADQDAVVRVGKLTDDTGKGLTDSLGYRALERFPVGYTPDVCFMTKRSQRQLRDSRTNTNGGAPNAPLPTDIAGIPIVLTDSILNTEALSL